MFFFNKWKESLVVFNNKNLKLFSLAVLNNFRRSFLVLFKNFWFLTTLALFLFTTSLLIFSSRCMDIFYHYLFCKLLYQYDFYTIILNFLVLFFAILLAFFLFLIVRPSIQSKSKGYFVHFFKRFLGFAIITLLFGELDPSFFFFVFYLFSFFYLDSSGGIRAFVYSFFNTLIFSFYFFPALLIFGSLRIFFRLLEKWLAISDFVMKDWAASFVLIKTFLLSLISFVVIPLFFLSIISVYYTKIRYNDFKFFYKL